MVFALDRDFGLCFKTGCSELRVSKSIRLAVNKMKTQCYYQRCRILALSWRFCKPTLKNHHLCGTVLWQLTEWNMRTVFTSLFNSQQIVRFFKNTSCFFSPISICLWLKYLKISNCRKRLSEGGERGFQRYYGDPPNRYTNQTYMSVSISYQKLMYITSVALAAPGAKVKASLLDSMRLTFFLK